MNAKSTSLESRIRQQWDNLSENERRLAEIILSAPGQVAMHTATELANSAGVSKATATRFFRHLGYDSYETVRRQVRDLQNSGSPLYLQKLAGSTVLSEVINTHLEREIANLVNTYRAFQPDELDSIVKGIAHARRIIILGWRHSQVIGSLLHRDLVNIHRDVQLLPVVGDSLAEYLAAVGPEDFAICIGLRRRMPVLAQAMNVLAERQVPMLYLADILSGKLDQQANWVIRCHTESSQIFDSASSVAGLCNLLCSLVARERGKSANDYMADIETLYDELDELE